MREQERQGRKIQRISINTLGPDDDEDLTNRIQKELVKQLVYRAKPGEIRRSRFARRKELTPGRALADAVGIGCVVVGLLWLFGIRPASDALGIDHLALSALAFLLLVVGAAWAARWFLGERPVSQFSTGGTSISFEKQPDSYFDEYLDEIVAFFDTTEPDFVIFEDLDRFDDPRIFDSLRELNTLINSSAHWKNRNRPLRFVYAIKDSLFERLGEGPETNYPTMHATRDQNRSEDAAGLEKGRPFSPVVSRLGDSPDAAVGAVERANRTKFFDVVIPVVPFISHSNARDLLSEALDQLGLPEGTELDRALLDLVARHATDMRLLINICNEFVVFAEQLLWVATPAPGMKASDLFALVAYKNFHLADFEALPHRGSALDLLERKRRELVRHSIKELQSRRRTLHRVNDFQEQQHQIAKALGDRLEASISFASGKLVRFEIGDTSEPSSAIRDRTFWRRVFEADALTAVFRERDRYGNTTERTVNFEREKLAALFPEGIQPHQWNEPSAEELAAQQVRIDEDVAELRGAGFSRLARDKRYSIDGMTFDQYLGSVLTSELAKDLVRRGFVDRYYAEYSAVFYGKFIGVDVAKFFRNSVQPNEMDIQFDFPSPEAVSNLLEQAPTGFTSSRAVFNISIVDYLLEHRPEQANEVAAFFVAEQSEEALAFLDAFLNDAASHKAELVGLLALQPWPRLFDHLALEDSVRDEDARSTLLDAALLSAGDAGSFDFGEQASALVTERHAQLSAFTEEHGADRAGPILSFVRRAGLVVPSLRSLSCELRRLVVDDGAYTLTADNLRAAVQLGDDEPISLDRIRINNAVWGRCSENLDTYFEAVHQDQHTEYAVQSAETLSELIAEQHGDWSEVQISKVLECSSPDAALPDIAKAPQEVWQAIATTRRMVPNIANLLAYSTALGVDEHLAKVLVDEEVPVELVGLEDVQPEDLHDLLMGILNASQVLPPKTRVLLALQLGPGTGPDMVDVTEIEPAEDDLLAELLTAGLVPDTAATFEHFLPAGWRAVSKAFTVSAAAENFLSADVVGEHALSLLREPSVSAGIKGKIIRDLATYVEEEDQEALREAAGFAHARQIKLPVSQIERVAPYVSDPEHVLWQLASMGEDLDGGAAIRVLSLMGGDFANFADKSGEEFDVPVSESTKAVLGVLREAGLATLPRGGKRGRKKVKLI